MSTLVHNAEAAFLRKTALDFQVGDTVEVSVRIPEGILRLTLACVLAISGLKLVQVANIWLAAAIGLSIVLITGLIVLERRKFVVRRDERLAAAAKT